METGFWGPRESAELRRSVEGVCVEMVPADGGPWAVG